MTLLSLRPGQARYQAVMLNRRHHMLRILPAVAASKAVAAVAAATLTVAAAGAVAATAVTGSPSPQVWGQHVKAAVVACKADLGQHGIGECVSDFASKRGQTEPSEHAVSPAESHGSSGPPAGHQTGRP